MGDADGNWSITLQAE